MPLFFSVWHVIELGVEVLHRPVRENDEPEGKGVGRKAESEAVWWKYADKMQASTNSNLIQGGGSGQEG